MCMFTSSEGAHAPPVQITVGSAMRLARYGSVDAGRKALVPSVYGDAMAPQYGMQLRVSGLVSRYITCILEVALFADGASNLLPKAEHLHDRVKA